MDVRDLLLATAFRNRLNEPNVEAGFERFLALTGQSVTHDAFCNAVADALRDRLIREPIRLPEGALQCHWHLELTSTGVDAARRVIDHATRPAEPGGSGESGGVAGLSRRYLTHAQTH